MKPVKKVLGDRILIKLPEVKEVIALNPPM